MKNKPIIVGIFALGILVLILAFSVYREKRNLVDVPKNNSQEVLVLTKGIQEKVDLINSEKDYRTKILRNQEFLDHMTDGGGELTGYFKDGKITKITEGIGLSYCLKTLDYYFWDGQLIFVYEKEEDFPYDENTGGLDHNNVALAFEGRYFFENGKLIETKNEGQKRYPDDSKIDVGQLLLTVSERNVELLSKQ